MKEETRVILWSTASAAAYCSVMVIASLTPLALIGNGTRFLSPGMWINLGMAGGSYIIPLLLYCLNVRIMKYIIAAVNGLWLLGLPFIMGLAVWGIRHVLPDGRISISCLIMAAAAGVSMILNILWYPMCRRKRWEV